MTYDRAYADDRKVEDALAQERDARESVKNVAVGNVKKEVAWATNHLHPTKKAEALRDIEAWAGDEAKAQEDKNERDGVPE